MNEIMVPAKLDLEWVKLIKEAKEAGLTVEEVKEFLYQEYKSKN
ncbi:anti-repressor SinI family protein [Alteribacillus sp. YIM 98480]|nr:anti-repressor SinI family protein [Alteribacillus sp. YIM 98480]